MRRAAGSDAVLAWGLLAANAALAAPSMAGVAWHSNADWQWLLGGSIVLLVVALILRAVKAANNSARDSDPNDAAMGTGNLYARRIGTTPIVAAERIDTPR